MFRKPFRVWLMLLLMGPGYALALEIGEIQVSSSLNQLFDAKIPLPKLAPEDLSKVSVKLAPPPMFKEFGLDRASVLANLIFSIEYNAEGEVYVKVVSTQPIREPSLGLLMEFSWPRGKTFREFTVFLDPVQRLAKRPADRTKTVLETAAAAAPEAAPAPTPASSPAPAPAEAATVPPELAVVSAPTPPSPVPAPAVAVAEAAPAPLPVEAPPPPVKAYKPGDSYGPVAAGEGLWKIALKVRPDPGITPDQMMQALFRANPHAFAKSGINGLKVGSTLRIPTSREIAKFTGSTAAKQLAETEEAAMSMLAETTKPSAEPSASEPNTAELQTDIAGPKAFPLEPPAAIEPIAVEVAPVSVQIEPAKSESAARPAVMARSVAPPVLEPVSATPQLFLAVSEVMASAIKIPAFAIPAQIVPGAIIADAPAPHPARKIPEIGAIRLLVATGQEIPTRKVSEVDLIASVATTEQVTEPPKASDRAAAVDPISDSPKPVPASDIAADLLAALDERVRFAALDLTPFVLEAKPSVAPSPEVEAASAMPPETPSLSPPAEIEKPAEQPPAEVAAPPVVELAPIEIAALPTIETATPPVIDVAVSPATESAGPTDEPAYKGGEQYGPVAPNERLWDIAAKVRPDPSIGKDVMMKALFVANPQAFSKPGMNQLKVGAVLRVPTLREIADYTGSTVAKQLLEQQAKSDVPPVSESAANPGPAGSGDEPKPVLESAAPVAETPPKEASPAD